MSEFYDRAQKLVADQLKKFGKPVVIKSASSAQFDQYGKKVGGDQATEVTVLAIFTPQNGASRSAGSYSLSQAADSNIRIDDQEVKLAAVDVDGNPITAPIKGDKIIDGDRAYQVIVPFKTEPANTPIIYTLICR